MVVITMSEDWSKTFNEIKSILTSQTLEFAVQNGIPMQFVLDSKQIQESIAAIASKFGDFADTVKKELHPLPPGTKLSPYADIKKKMDAKAKKGKL